jgi:hypothetical protein
MATGACATLAACCATLPSSEQTGCTSVVNLGSQPACQEAVSGLEDAGVCP